MTDGILGEAAGEVAFRGAFVSSSHETTQPIPCLTAVP